MTARPGRSQPPRTYSKHGLTTLKGAVNALGSRTIDKRTALGKALAAWRADLVADLGGRDALSTQQAALIDLCVKTRLILDSIDSWLLTQPSLINLRKRALLPVVRQRQQLADALARYLTTLGLERRSRPVPSFDAYIAERYGSELDQKAEGDDRHNRHTVTPPDPEIDGQERPGATDDPGSHCDGGGLRS